MLLGVGRRGTSFAVLSLYCATSVLLFGWALWPHPGRGTVGLIPDPEIFIWSLAWWAHALTTFMNPFVTNVVYYPTGVNLMWTASGQGLALVLIPLTLLVGPTAAYNIAMLLLPGLGAWTAFRLCRCLSGSTWGSIVGGYLFGFSGYVVAHVYGGDLNLCLFLAPLAALAVLRYLRGDLRARGLVWRLGLILAFQYTISTELALTMTLAIAAGLLIGLAVVPRRRREIVSALPVIVGAYAVAALLAAPFIVYTLKGYESGTFVNDPNDDLLNFVIPTRLIAAGGSTFAATTGHFATTIVDSDLYIGIPTLAIIGLYGWRRRQDAAARFLIVSFLIACLFALGSPLRIDGHRFFELPWGLLARLPLIPNAIPGRLAEYVSLSAAVAVSLWIASAAGRFLARPVVLPVLALASILPATWNLSFVSHPPRPAFFSQKIYKICIPRGETLLVFPYARFGDSMLYQAESGFWFKLSEGNLGRDTYPPSFVFADPTVTALQFYYYGPGPRPTMAALKTYAKRRHVDRVVTLQTSPYPSGVQMHAFGPLQVLGGVLVAPACGYNSLAGDTRRIPGQ